MRYKLIAAILFSFCTIGYSQKDSSTYYKFEFTFSTGWNNTWEPFPVGFSYRPNIFNRVLELNTGFNINLGEGAKLSGGISLYPFKTKRFTPYIGADYILATGGYQLNDNTGAGILVNYNSYIYPYFAVKFNPRKTGSYFLIFAKLGYSYLLKTNPHPVTLVGGTQEVYNFALNEIKSNYMVSLGVAFPFNSLKPQIH